jgi:catechol 2,3-dioxygenase-like lactoylglutathione lyase family enzyme
VEATQEAAATWAITGARHAGITVSDLDRSLEFYCSLLGLELLWRRRYEEREIAEIVGVPEATAFDIAFLGIPGSDTQVELLQYHGVEQVSGAVPPSRHGGGHFCLFVRDVDALHGDLAARGVRFRSPGPVEMRSGPNRGGKSLYSHDPDGYVIELHERPPHVG